MGHQPGSCEVGRAYLARGSPRAVSDSEGPSRSSVLPVPFAFARMGVLPGVVTALVVAYANTLTSTLLLRAAAHTGCYSYEGIAEAVGGRVWKVSAARSLQEQGSPGLGRCMQRPGRDVAAAETQGGSAAASCICRCRLSCSDVCVYGNCCAHGVSTAYWLLCTEYQLYHASATVLHTLCHSFPCCCCCCEAQPA